MIISNETFKTAKQKCLFPILLFRHNIYDNLLPKNNT